MKTLLCGFTAKDFRLLPCLLSLAILSCDESGKEKSGEAKIDAKSSSTQIQLTKDTQIHSKEFLKERDFVERYLAAPTDEAKKALRVEHSKQGDLFQELSATELAELLNSFDLTNDYNDPAVSSAMRALARKDVPLFIEKLMQYGGANWFANEPSIAKILVNTDTDAVNAWLAATDLEEKHPIIPIFAHALLDALSNDDPAKKAEIILERKKPATRYLWDTYSAWAKSDPSSAMLHALEHAKGGERDGSINTVLLATNLRDSLKAHNLAEQLDDLGFSVNEDVLSGIFSGIAKTDPEEAVFILQEMPDHQIRKTLETPETIEKIVDRAPTAAIAAVSKVTFSRSTEPLYLRTVKSLASKDPQLAREWVTGFPDSPAKQTMLDHIDAYSDH